MIWYPLSNISMEYIQYINRLKCRNPSCSNELNFERDQMYLMELKSYSISKPFMRIQNKFLHIMLLYESKY